jgi:hypothetical protein
MDVAPDNREGVARDIAKIAGLTALALSLVATISFLTVSNNPSTSELSSIESAVEKLSNQNSYDSDVWDSSWLPEGFIVWPTNINIAWKWSDKNNCSDYACLSADFISRNGCPNGLYAAINWLDSDENVISYSNDSIPSLLPMQTAILKFDDIEGFSKSGQMSTINCR